MLHAPQEHLTRSPVCMHAADVNLLKVPDTLSDSKVLLLSDVLPTAWHATELGAVSEGDRVAIWGAGPGMSLDLSSPPTLRSPCTLLPKRSTMPMAGTCAWRHVWCPVGCLGCATLKNNYFYILLPAQWASWRRSAHSCAARRAWC